MKKTIILPILLLAGCYNLTGANKEAAEQNAELFAEELNLDLMGVTCNRHDTDDDGYISCTFSFKGGEVKTFECAGRNIVQNNTGCREPKIKIPTVSTKD